MNNDVIKVISPQKMHLPCVMLFDKSGSMNYPKEEPPINALNAALEDFKEMFKEGKFGGNQQEIDRLSAVDVCIIAFGGKGTDGTEPDIEILQNFAPATEMFYTKKIVADGGTPLAKAFEKGLEKIVEIKKHYKNNDIEYYRPWLICLTDGESTETLTDEGKEYYNSIKEKLAKETEGNHVLPYGIGVGKECNYKELSDFIGDPERTFKLVDDAKGFANLLILVGNSFTVGGNDGDSLNGDGQPTLIQDPDIINTCPKNNDDDDDDDVWNDE